MVMMAEQRGIPAGLNTSARCVAEMAREGSNSCKLECGDFFFMGLELPVAHLNRVRIGA
jgi:hypothetical protein